MAFINERTKEVNCKIVYYGPPRCGKSTSLRFLCGEIKKDTKGGSAYVSIKNVTVTLNATAMGAIHATFGTPLPDSVKLGTANVLARVAH